MVLLVLVFNNQLDSDTAVRVFLICWHLCAANTGFSLLVLHALTSFVSKKKIIKKLQSCVEHQRISEQPADVLE